jgi:6-phosphogluconolactonase
MLSLLALLAPASVLAADPELHVFIGTYTDNGKSEGIYHAKLNLKSGALSKPEAAAKITNPSFLAIDPSGQFLYAVAEVDRYEGQPGGGIESFAIDADKRTLKSLNHQSTRGTIPCHCVVDKLGKNVLVANYGSGSVACLPINADGSLKPISSFDQHEGHGPNKDRQEGPHAHSINLDAANRFAVAADLGVDKLYIYKFDADAGSLTANDPPSTSVEPGAGPRHFAFHPNGQFAYVIDELALTITAFQYSPQAGVLYGIQTIRTVPDDIKGSQYSTAEVQVHPSGKFVYGSNRGHDTIAMFRVDPKSGLLKSLGQKPTKGKTPRNFGIDPTGQFLLAANQDSDTIVVFRIDAESGELNQVGEPVAVPKPACVKFLK